MTMKNCRYNFSNAIVLLMDATDPTGPDTRKQGPGRSIDHRLKHCGCHQMLVLGKQDIDGLQRQQQSSHARPEPGENRELVKVGDRVLLERRRVKRFPRDFSPPHPHIGRPQERIREGAAKPDDTPRKLGNADDRMLDQGVVGRFGGSEQKPSRAVGTQPHALFERNHAIDIGRTTRAQAHPVAFRLLPRIMYLHDSRIDARE